MTRALIPAIAFALVSTSIAAPTLAKESTTLVGTVVVVTGGDAANPTREVFLRAEGVDYLVRGPQKAASLGRLQGSTVNVKGQVIESKTGAPVIRVSKFQPTRAKKPKQKPADPVEAAPATADPVATSEP